MLQTISHLLICISNLGIVQGYMYWKLWRKVSKTPELIPQIINSWKWKASQAEKEGDHELAESLFSLASIYEDYYDAWEKQNLEKKEIDIRN